MKLKLEFAKIEILIWALLFQTIHLAGHIMPLDNSDTAMEPMDQSTASRYSKKKGYWGYS
jgi:hypothetical protein